MGHPKPLTGAPRRNDAEGAIDVSYRGAANQQEYDDELAGDGFVEYWNLILRHRGTILLTAVLGALAGFLYTLPQTPIYQASTTIEAQGLNENFLNMKDYNPTTSSGSQYDSSVDLRTQVKLMQSKSLIDRVAAKLKKNGAPEVSVPTDRLSEWKKALGFSGATAAGPRGAQPYKLPILDLTVKATGTTRIIEVTCDSPDPKLAADYANTLVNEFIDQSMEERWKTTERTGQWLTRQLEDLKIKLEKSEDELQAYASTAGLQFTGGDGSKESGKENVADEKLRQLQSEMLKAQSERVAAQSKYEMAASSPVDSLPQALEASALGDYQAKLTGLRQQLAEISTTLTPEHYKVKKVQAQIAELEAATGKERTNLVTRIRNEFEAAERRERLIAAEYAVQAKVVNEQAGKTIHYGILKREVDTNRQVYEGILQKVKESGVASAMRASIYRVVDAAETPAAPYKPNPVRSSLMGAFGGVLLGIGFVLMRERADRRLQQPGELALYLNLPELGVIPSEKVGLSKRLHGKSPAPGLNGNGWNGNGNGNGHGSLDLATWKRKPSLLAESFRLTLASILFSGQNGDRPQVIAITSAGPSEGKSTVVSNLAVVLAEINRRVLVIDADMRRPRLHAIFGVSNDDGLSELLNEKTAIVGRPIPASVRETEAPGLYLLPSGQIANNASNLLYSPRLDELIAVCRQEFDTILIDTPPLLHLADARVLGRHCDTMILVARAGQTTRDAAIAARKKLQEDGTPILGTILNDWNPDSNGFGYGNKYYDGYSKYYRAEKE